LGCNNLNVSFPVSVSVFRSSCNNISSTTSRKSQLRHGDIFSRVCPCVFLSSYDSNFWSFDIQNFTSQLDLQRRNLLQKSCGQTHKQTNTETVNDIKSIDSISEKDRTLCHWIPEFINPRYASAHADAESR